MVLANQNFLSLPNNYLFSEIARRVQAYRSEHPEADIISLGIGDVTRPLPKASVEAMRRAVDEMSRSESFRGYGPEHGYDFLIDAIIEHDYRTRGVELSRDEVLISDGAKSDCGNIGDILSLSNSVAMTDPVYPVYIDSNIMSGRVSREADGAWNGITLLPCDKDNSFMPSLPEHQVNIIYLCYPNNPTGTVLGRSELKRWVDYALENDSLIIYDGAYEAFIQDSDVPHSIYEIDGARGCAIELRSFSKTAGFTGVRCGYTVIPIDLTASTASGERVSLNALWNRRQCTKFNGTSYITQRGAEAIYTTEGMAQVRELVGYYMDNARIMKSALREMGYNVVGGDNAPYIWLESPDGSGSWDFFHRLLIEANIVVTPGVGFGPSGEGFIRITAFGNRSSCEEAMRRMRNMSR